MKLFGNIHTEIYQLPQYELHFHQCSSGWCGSDLAFSVPLTQNRILWLFGDTFIQPDAKIRGRQGAAIINNSIAIQDNPQSAKESIVKYYWKHTATGPQSFFLVNERPGFLWPFSAILIHDKLYVFAMRMEHKNVTDVFGFRQIGNEIICIPNPHDAPEKWEMQSHILPWQKEIGSFGSYLLIDKKFLYIYGFRQENDVWLKNLKFIVARVNIHQNSDIADMTTWEFYDGSQNNWSPNIHNTDFVFNNSTTEFSITYLQKMAKYVLVANSYETPNPIIIRLAETPYGPFSQPENVYFCPETLWNPQYFCYAAKAHPELTQHEDELIITYATNSRNLNDCFNDLRIYFPRFIRVRLNS